MLALAVTASETVGSVAPARGRDTPVPTGSSSLPQPGDTRRRWSCQEGGAGGGRGRELEVRGPEDASQPGCQGRGAGWQGEGEWDRQGRRRAWHCLHATVCEGRGEVECDSRFLGQWTNKLFWKRGDPGGGGRTATEAQGQKCWAWETAPSTAIHGASLESMEARSGDSPAPHTPADIPLGRPARQPDLIETAAPLSQLGWGVGGCQTRNKCKCGEAALSRQKVLSPGACPSPGLTAWKERATCWGAEHRPGAPDRPGVR